MKYNELLAIVAALLMDRDSCGLCRIEPAIDDAVELLAAVEKRTLTNYPR